MNGAGAELGVAPARDRLGRPLRDLRISVTDRCNFRCGYCMPLPDYGPGHRFLRQQELLSNSEIAQVAAAAVRLGVRKIRLTGGEPLLRPDLEPLIAALAPLPGLEDLALTTNGSALAARAKGLRAAGLRRLTVSLDSLHPRRFAARSGVGAELAPVLAGLEAAQAAGFVDLKLNCVVQADNRDDVAALARRFRHRGPTVRFIEYMDVGGASGWRREQVVTAAEIRALLAPVGELLPIDRSEAGAAGAGVAQRYRWADGGGEVGIIASVTDPFCRDCVRLRLTADGTLYTCLFSGAGQPLRPLLRGGAGAAEVAEAIAGRWAERSDRYSEQRGASLGADGQRLVELTAKVAMSRVGG